MAGMEQLEIHSRVSGACNLKLHTVRFTFYRRLTWHIQSYLIRWVNVTAQQSISWSIQPKKRTIQFGIFKHPGSASTNTPKIPSSPTLPDATIEEEPPRESRGERHVSETAVQEQGSSLTEKLQKLGMKQVSWLGRCEADRVTMGHYDVLGGEDGMYGLVFDNTQSKQFSKTVTFVLMTYPTSTPPASGSNSHMALAQALAGRQNRRVSPSKRGSYIPAASGSSDEVDGDGRPDSRSKSAADNEPTAGHGASFYTGVLSKRRRKQHQGYAKRFFSLDFTSSTLSYYKNRNSSALRGSMPLSLAAIGANEKARQISVDSGAEIWLLKAGNQHDFVGWRDALERATQPTASSPMAKDTLLHQTSGIAVRSGAAEDEEWSTIEKLVAQVSGITASVRRIAKDTDPKYMPASTGHDSVASSPVEVAHEDYFDSDAPKSPRPLFWRRKSSRNQTSTSPFARNVSGDRLAPPSPDPLNLSKVRSQSPSRPKPDTPADVHDRCMAVLRDLDSVVANFSNLIAQSKERRFPARPEPVARASIDSIGPQEFFDAEEGRSSRFLTISRDPEGDGASDRGDAVSINSASTISVSESYADTTKQNSNKLFPGKPKSLSPLPHTHVNRRSTIPPAKAQPPSLFAFLRKNVGKDLSTIAMPVTTNEPLSLLQRSAEPLEYAKLIDTAAGLPPSSTDSEGSSAKKLLLITAFAVSGLACNRARERAVRKPFNPMLGETYELVREDLGFRFLAEKVTHRPVRVACQAEGGNSSSSPCTWTYTHAPSPSQKFWGKSAELVTDGLCRVQLHTGGERYSWAPAHAFLRNIVAGDKYVEPVGTMVVTEETSGCKAVVTFKAGGMFSGRSEEVSVACYDVQGREMSVGMSGKWTSDLSLSSGETVWKANPLLPQAASRFGFTSFAATLNEVTSLEQKALPPTDSRLRPDQRAYEDGDVDGAEDVKVKLEEAQRRRRKEMETAGEEWRPRWFEKVSEKQGDEGEEVWRMRGADQPGTNYWDVREAVVDFKGGKWDGVREVFAM